MFDRALPFTLLLLLSTASVPGFALEKPPVSTVDRLKQDDDEEEVDAFPPSPLELDEDDPLLPAVDRPLTPTERQILARELDRLNAEAQAEYEAGNVGEAFELWNRELRLRRFISSTSELQALGRVGAIAWEESDLQQVQAIGQRLRVIERELFYPEVEENDWDELDEYEPVTVDVAVLQPLAAAYDAAGARDEAARIYNLILVQLRSQNNRIALEETLQSLAQLNLKRLNYEAAAQNYEELVELTLARGNRASAVIYLEQLAFAYDRLEDPARSLPVRQQLLEYYTAQQNGSKVVELQLGIGQDYKALGQLNNAIDSYEAAYSLAWSLQELHQAARSLQLLAELYESQRRFDAALQVYRAELEVHRWANNKYGSMLVYDRIGRVYRSARQYRSAREAFQNGLVLAQELGDRVAYFTVQIEQLDRALSQQ